ncbi:MAG: hypothetical protein KF891_04625 [Rhizobacter sp.]|nr:hypothetical protein [Rhizobacter sp.]
MPAAHPLHRLWLRIAAAGYAGVLLLLLWTWWTPPFQGDLARMARVSEAEFGATLEQPALDERLLVSVRMADADVLVLGDSFSQELRWQTVLVAQGLRVKTLHWRQLPGLCGDIGAWARERGFKGSLIVAESVERELRPQLHKNPGCRMQADPLAASLPDEEHHTTPPPTRPPPVAMNWSETLLTGAITAWNMQRVAHASDEIKLGAVRMRPLPDGCRYFSHRACDKTLLLGADAERAPPGPPELDALQAAQRTIGRDVPLLWIVVPDKTSVYFPRGNDAFWQALPGRGLGPDLHRVFVASKAQRKDLYEPDDTHLSAAGYLLLGEQVREAIERLGVAKPRAAAP